MLFPHFQKKKEITYAQELHTDDEDELILTGLQSNFLVWPNTNTYPKGIIDLQIQAFYHPKIHTRVCLPDNVGKERLFTTYWDFYVKESNSKTLVYNT